MSSISKPPPAPGWHGTLPAGLQRLDAPTNTVWIILRVFVRGPEDLPNVVALQSRFTLEPLGSKPNYPPPGPPGVRKEVVPQIFVMSLQDYFGRLLRVMRDNPPPPRDAALVGQMKLLGLDPKDGFDATKLEPDVHRGLQRALAKGRNLVRDLPRSGANRGGWVFAISGPWEVDYLNRAKVALVGFAAHCQEEAIYGRRGTDDSGRNLEGTRRYVLRFDPGRLPPVNAFWSITLYDADRLLVDNPIKRYSISDRTPGIAKNPDGSLEIHVQHEAPQGRESNWLPAPEGLFRLSLRLYLPRPEAIDGRWTPPSVKEVSAR